MGSLAGDGILELVCETHFDMNWKEELVFGSGDLDESIWLGKGEGESILPAFLLLYIPLSSGSRPLCAMVPLL